MASNGIIVALDIATNTGWSVGRPSDARPISGSVRLKKPEDIPQVAFRNMERFMLETILKGHCFGEEPALVVYEAPINPGAMMNMGNGADAVILAWGLVGALEASVGRFGLRSEAANVQTVRKHFTGVARHGARAEAKSAVIQRCRTLGYMKPDDRADDNRADALAVWDWAAHRFGKRVSGDMEMFRV